MKAFQLAIAAIAFGAFTAPVFAAGSDDNSAPEPTTTVKECKKNKVWSSKKGRCVKPENASLSDEQLYNDIRSLAYAGRYEHAQSILSAMPDQQDDRALTYWGFTHRKLGNVDQAMIFYQKALATNPDNLLARSYMGQAFVETNQLDLARAQLSEIRTRGGSDGWAAHSLAASIQSGTVFNY